MTFSKSNTFESFLNLFLNLSSEYFLLLFTLSFYECSWFLFLLNKNFLKNFFLRIWENLSTFWTSESLWKSLRTSELSESFWSLRIFWELLNISETLWIFWTSLSRIWERLNVSESERIWESLRIFWTLKRLRESVWESSERLNISETVWLSERICLRVWVSETERLRQSDSLSRI